MEEIINKFNELVQEMANGVAEASSPEEAEKLQAEWDKDIDKAEKEMQEELEAFIKSQDDALLAEQKASEDEIKELEEDKDPIDDSKDSELDVEALKKEFPNKTFINKLKEATIVELAVELGLDITMDDKVTKSRKIIIEYFTENIW